MARFFLSENAVKYVVSFAKRHNSGSGYFSLFYSSKIGIDSVATVLAGVMVGYSKCKDSMKFPLYSIDVDDFTIYIPEYTYDKIVDKFLDRFTLQLENNWSFTCLNIKDLDTRDGEIYTLKRHVS